VKTDNTLLSLSDRSAELLDLVGKAVGRGDLDSGWQVENDSFFISAICPNAL
jgi:hypothetical protein